MLRSSQVARPHTLASLLEPVAKPPVSVSAIMELGPGFEEAAAILDACEGADGVIAAGFEAFLAHGGCQRRLCALSSGLKCPA